MSLDDCVPLEFVRALTASHGWPQRRLANQREQRQQRHTGFAEEPSGENGAEQSGTFVHSLPWRIAISHLLMLRIQTAVCSLERELLKEW